MTYPNEDKDLSWLLRDAAVDVEAEPWEYSRDRRADIQLARDEVAQRVGRERAERLTALVRQAQRGESPMGGDEVEGLVALAVVAGTTHDVPGPYSALGRVDRKAVRDLVNLVKGNDWGFRMLVHAGTSSHQRGEFYTTQGRVGWDSRWQPLEGPPTWDDLVSYLADTRSKEAKALADRAQQWARRKAEEARLATAKAERIAARARAAAERAEVDAKAAEAYAKAAEAYAEPTLTRKVAGAVAQGARKAAVQAVQAVAG